MVTLPPVIFPTQSDPARDSFTTNTHHIGPYIYTGPSRRYMILQASAFPANEIRCYKSTDDGVTWVIQDTGNGPPNANTNSWQVEELNGILYVIYQDNGGGGLRVQSFDTSTDTWGVIKTGGATPSIQGWRTGITTTGKIFIIYQNAVSFVTNNLKYQIYDTGAGTFGAAADFTTSVVGTSDQFPCNVYIDSTDKAHVVFNTMASNQNIIHHRTVTLGGTLGTNQVIQSEPSHSGYEIGVISRRGNVIVVPSVPGGAIQDPPLASVWEGTGETSDTPTWTALTTVDLAPVVTPGNGDQYVYSVTSVDGLTSYIFWFAEDYSDINNVIDRLYYASNTGTGWSQPNLMYDAVTNPQLEDPSELPENQFLHTLSITVNADGTFGLYVAMEENGFCAGYYLLDQASSCVITTIPPTLAGVVIMPDATGAHYAQTLIAYEVPGDTFSYAISSSTPPPPGFEMSNQTRTINTTTGPIEVNDGVIINGEPTFNDYMTVETTTMLVHLRLIQ